MTTFGISRSPRSWLTCWRLAPVVGAGLGLTACLDDSPVATGNPTVRATFSANVVGAVAGGSVRIRVGYRTRTQQIVFLPSTPQQVDVPAGSTIVQPVTVDIGRCLADRNRTSASEPGCRLLIELSLSDQTGVVIDSDTTDATGSPTVPGGAVNFGTVTVGTVVASIVVDPTSLRLNVGQDQQLTATAKDSKGVTIPSVAVTWTTSDASVAQLTSTGATSVTVRALKLGQATISASARGKTSPPVTLGVVPTTLTIRQQPAAGCVIAGQTVTLAVESPPGAVSWSSSDPTVATVGASTGVVTGVKPGGSATITATSAGITGTATVCVAQFSITPTTVTLAAGRTTPLTVSASGGTVSFVSSAPAVATVDAAGVVRGVSVGRATITATLTAASGTQSIPVTVSVTAASVAIKATLSKAPLGRSVKYTVVITDANGAPLPGVDATWSIADPTIAALSNPTGTTVEVKALKLGTTTVSATVGDIVATADFTSTPVIPASRLEAVSGNGSSCPTYSTKCTLVARALDVDGFPVAGAPVRWSTTNQGCAEPKSATTDDDGLTSATNLCSANLPGLYEQTVSLANVPEQAGFHYFLRGLVLTLQSFDTSGVATYSVTSATPAEGLSVTVAYRSGPATNYVTQLDLNGSTTPAVLVVKYDRSALPPGLYTFDVIVSTTTPGIGPAVASESFEASTGLGRLSNPQTTVVLRGASPTMSRRVP